MNAKTQSNPFKFEEDLIQIKKQLSEAELNTLKAFRTDQTDMAAAVERFHLNSTLDNALSARQVLTDSIDSAPDYYSLIQKIYFESPRPEDAAGRFDYGAEEKRRENALAAIKDIQSQMEATYEHATTENRIISTYISEHEIPDIPDEDLNIEIGDSQNIWEFINTIAAEPANELIASISTSANTEDWIDSLSSTY